MAFEGYGLKIKVYIEDTRHSMKYQKESFISEDMLGGLRNDQKAMVRAHLEEACEAVFSVVEPTLIDFSKAK